MSFALGFIAGVLCGGLLVAAMFIRKAIRVVGIGEADDKIDLDPLY